MKKHKVESKIFYSELIGPELGSGGGKWKTAVAAADGTVFCPPWRDDQVLRIHKEAHCSGPGKNDIRRIGPEIAGREKYRCGFLGRDGNIYCPPWCASHVLRINTATDEVELIGPDFSGVDDKWREGVLGKDGAIYCLPWAAPFVLKIDTTTGEVDMVGPDFGLGGGKWRAAVTLFDGRIYCPPHDASRILRIDPDRQEVDLIGPDLGPGPAKYWTALPCGNEVFCPPWGAAQVLHIDAQRATASLIGDDLGPEECKCKWRSIALAGATVAFCPPCCANQVLRIDTAERQATLVGPDLCYGGFKYYHAVPGEDGRVYCPPWNASKVMCITLPGEDCDDIELMRPDLGPGGGKYRSVVVGPDGYFLCVPWVGQQALRIDTSKGIFESLLPKLGTERDKWGGGAFGYWNTLYCPPFNTSKVLNIGFSDMSADSQKKK